MISSTVVLIFFLIFKIFNKTLVNPRYLISSKSNIDWMPKFFKFDPPTDKYSISLLSF